MQRMLMVLLVDTWLRREFPDAVPVPLQGTPGPQAQSGVLRQAAGTRGNHA
jgi:hypothetical protein